jgi:hypothetical protein
MLFLITIGFTLMVLSLRLVFLWNSFRKTKEENLRKSGITILVLGLFLGIVTLIIKLTNILPIEEIKALSNVAIAIALTGGVVAIQGQIQQKPEQIKVLGLSIIITAVIGLGCIITYAFI